jgi:hypothetical protein
MKKLLVTSVLSLACVGAFAQGKVTFGNDNAHLVMYGTDTTHLTATYSSLAGQAVAQAGGANPINMGLFTVELLAGATAGNLSVFSTVSGAAAGLPDGRFPNTSVTLAGLPGGTPAFGEVRIWETAAGSWAATQTGAGRTTWLQAASPVFGMTPGGFAPTPIVSTWPAGALNLGTVDPVPEPSTFALAGLGAAAMLIFRRRK